MATELGVGYLSIIPETSKIAPGVAASLNGPGAAAAANAGKTGGARFGGTFGASFKKVIGPALALGAATATIGFLKDSVGEAREAQKVGALTNNVIKTTGGIANISAKQVEKLSTAISNKTGIDDEAVQSGANLLLTFKNVRNEAGKGANIFDRATEAAADLSASGFGDLKGASKQLGKALNDPVKGISALGRAGVTFTEGQKKQIKTMVKAGDTLGAQKIILKEVESQVGGAAEATATNGEKMKVAFGNLQESIGTALIPVLDKAAAAGVKAVAWMQKNPAAMKSILFGLLGVAGAFTAMFIAANIIPIAIAAVVGGLVYAYTKVGWFRDGVNAAAEGIGKAFTWLWDNVLRPVFQIIVGAVGVVLISFGKMLSAMGRVPGFGWAKKAGDAMTGAGEDALGLAREIDKIPNGKKIKIETPGMDRALSQAKSLKVLLGGGPVSKNPVNKVSPGQFDPNAYASGTNSSAAGLARIHEEGGEIVNLPGGTQVIPHDVSMAMAQAAGANSGGGVSPRDIRNAMDGMTLFVPGLGNARLSTAGA